MYRLVILSHVALQRPEYHQDYLSASRSETKCVVLSHTLYPSPYVACSKAPIIGDSDSIPNPRWHVKNYGGLHFVLHRATKPFLRMLVMTPSR
jgi:hypothetical protein